MTYHTSVSTSTTLSTNSKFLFDGAVPSRVLKKIKIQFVQFACISVNVMCSAWLMFVGNTERKHFWFLCGLCRHVISCLPSFTYFQNYLSVTQTNTNSLPVSMEHMKKWYLLSWSCRMGKEHDKCIVLYCIVCCVPGSVNTKALWILERPKGNYM